MDYLHILYNVSSMLIHQIYLQEKVTSPTLSQKSSNSTAGQRESAPPSVRAVDLTSESSSVLGNMRSNSGAGNSKRGALRKLSTSSNVSRSSTGSAQKYIITDHQGRLAPPTSQQISVESDDIDSGMHTMYDSQSQSSASSSQPHNSAHSAPSPEARKSPSYTSRIHGMYINVYVICNEWVEEVCCGGITPNFTEGM